MLTAEIEVLRDNRTVHVVPVGPHALLVGRSPDNDLVLADARVSGHHLVIHWDEARLVVRDLGSRNHTYLHETQVTGPTVVTDGDVLRLGSSVTLRVRLVSSTTDARPARPRILLTDMTTGLAYPLTSDRFRIGARDDADLRLPGGPPLVATIVCNETGEIWVGTDDEEFPVTIGQPFELGGHRFLLRDDRNQDRSTINESAFTKTSYPYRLRVHLHGQTGPEAQLEDPRSGQMHVIRAENRVVLLYVLGVAAVKDRQRLLPEADRGWCADEEAMLGIWGKRWESMGANNYQVLLCRLRKELNDAGLDGWFIEKRRGFTRLALDAITIS